MIWGTFPAPWGVQTNAERREAGTDTPPAKRHGVSRGLAAGSFIVKVIEFLQETEECEAVDKKGNPIRKFIGSIFKATLSKGERETLDKAEVKKLLNNEDYQKVSKVSVYPVLRIS